MRVFLGYYHHANDYYSEGLEYNSIGEINVCDNKFTDLWLTNGPALGMNGTGAYEEEIFRNHTLGIIANHSRNNARARATGLDEQPLFLFHAFHLAHSPLQVPEDYLNQFKFIDDVGRRHYAAMVKYLDDVVGDIVAALKTEGMYNNTLIVFSSDNGGPLYVDGNANNYPLRGGKYADFEGGVRTNAFVSGGYLPAARRGTQQDSLIHISDWYATFCEIAGVDPTDTAAAAAGLPPIDSISAAPLLGLVDGSTGKGSRWKQAAARTEIHLSSMALLDSDGWKLVTGVQPQTGWTGPLFPNMTGRQPLPPMINVPALHWNFDCGEGCLFNVHDDEARLHR
eukprot:INCI6231.4.p1 GENE.INCI6231.4~~INCI6231.4.p1  ORF type:complete len:339 (-),score=69.53 INCI6231.4:293-1309(-)